MSSLAILAVAAAGALAGVLAAAGAREAVMAWPAALAWLRTAVEPLRRAGAEGHSPTVLERRRLALLGAGVLLASGWLIAGPVAALALSVAGPAAAGWAVSVRHNRYRTAVERGLPGFAGAVADALAGGRSVRGALPVALASVEGPIAVEMGRVSADLALGAPTVEALGRLRSRLRSPRADSFVAAALSPRLAGGELALLLRRYATAAAERDRLSDDTRAATAQARFTGLLVVAMPAGGAVFGELISPGFIASLLASPAATALVIAAAAMQAMGFAAIRRLSVVDR